MPSVKNFTYDKYVALFVEYFDLNKKDIKASILFLSSPSEAVSLAT